MLKMQEKIERLHVAFNNYVKCEEIGAAEHIIGDELLDMKRYCEDLVKEIDMILEKL